MTAFWMAILTMVILFKDCSGSNYSSELHNISVSIDRLTNELNQLKKIILEWKVTHE